MGTFFGSFRACRPRGGRFGDENTATHNRARGRSVHVCTGVTLTPTREFKEIKSFLGVRISDRCRHRKGTPGPRAISPSLDVYITNVSKLGDKGPGHSLPSLSLSLSSIVRGPISPPVLLGWYSWVVGWGSLFYADTRRSCVRL